MALIPVAPDHLATVVTTMEMRERPPLRPVPPSPLRLARWRSPDPAKYRDLFRRVGAPWLWYSRLAMDDARLEAKLREPNAEIYAATGAGGVELGLLELDFAAPGVAELTFLALVPELIGAGHGRWLMAQTLQLAWRPGVERMALNTCTLDHPNALGFYRRHGFTAVKRTVETFPDPRALGLLPADCAPQVPYLAESRR